MNVEGRGVYKMNIYYIGVFFLTLSLIIYLFYLKFFFLFRYYLKHTVLEQAFDQLCEAGFRYIILGHSVPNGPGYEL